MSKHIPLPIRKVLALLIYGLFLYATWVSLMANPAPGWADYVAAMPVYTPLVILALRRDERPFERALDGAVACIDYIIDYVTGTLPPREPEKRQRQECDQEGRPQQG